MASCSRWIEHFARHRLPLSRLNSEAGAACRGDEPKFEAASQLFGESVWVEKNKEPEHQARSLVSGKWRLTSQEDEGGREGQANLQEEAYFGVSKSSAAWLKCVLVEQSFSALTQGWHLGKGGGPWTSGALWGLGRSS